MAQDGRKIKGVRIYRPAIISGSAVPQSRKGHFYLQGSKRICGVGDYTALLARELAKDPSVSVGVLTSKSVSSELNSPIDLLAIVEGWRLNEFTKILRAIRGWKPDLIHFQFHTLGYGKKALPYIMPLLFRAVGLTVVQTWHESPFGTRFIPNALVRGPVVGVEPDFVERMPAVYRLLARRKAYYVPVCSNIPIAEPTEQERGEIRKKYVDPDRKLVAFFGFVHPHKGVEQIFEVADPQEHSVVLITELDESDEYQRSILRLANGDRWRGRVHVTGHLSSKEVGEILAAADAAVFPFRDGIGMRNASFLAARAQGTFVVTTSHTAGGYDPVSNVYHATVGAVEEMKKALKDYAGTRVQIHYTEPRCWPDVASQHVGLYKMILREAGR
jgi:glycosyltransferase involved in cell wall biosynthesis